MNVIHNYINNCINICDINKYKRSRIIGDINILKNFLNIVNIQK